MYNPRHHSKANCFGQLLKIKLPNADNEENHTSIVRRPKSTETLEGSVSIHRKYSLNIVLQETVGVVHLRHCIWTHFHQAFLALTSAKYHYIFTYSDRFHKSWWILTRYAFIQGHCTFLRVFQTCTSGIPCFNCDGQTLISTSPTISGCIINFKVYWSRSASIGRDMKLICSWHLHANRSGILSSAFTPVPRVSPTPLQTRGRFGKYWRSHWFFNRLWLLIFSWWRP